MRILWWFIDRVFGAGELVGQSQHVRAVGYSPDIFPRNIHVFDEIVVEIEARGKLDMLFKNH